MLGWSFITSYVGVTIVSCCHRSIMGIYLFLVKILSVHFKIASPLTRAKTASLSLAAQIKHGINPYPHLPFLFKTIQEAILRCLRHGLVFETQGIEWCRWWLSRLVLCMSQVPHFVVQMEKRRKEKFKDRSMRGPWKAGCKHSPESLWPLHSNLLQYQWKVKGQEILVHTVQQRDTEWLR